MQVEDFKYLHSLVEEKLFLLEQALETQPEYGNELTKTGLRSEIKYHKALLEKLKTACDPA